MDALTLSTAVAAGLAAVSLGGGLYEVTVIDPAWPGNPALIQARNGGVDRKRFWIPAHGAFEAALLASLAIGWGEPAARAALLVALASHGVMRAWSFAEFIPRALAFERTDPWAVSGPAAVRWARRSRTRLALDAVTAGACLAAFAGAA